MGMKSRFQVAKKMSQFKAFRLRKARKKKFKFYFDNHIADFADLAQPEVLFRLSA
jgi:hypothetical protein